MTVADALAAMPPRLATTVPLNPTGGPAHVPWLTEQDVNVVPAGSGSVTVTAVAALGPPLETVTVYVRLWPCRTGLGEAVLTPETSAPEMGVGVGEGVVVGVGVPVGGTMEVDVGVSVGVRVADAVFVGEVVGVALGVFVRVGVGEGVDVAVKVGVFVKVEVKEGVSVGESGV